MITPGRLRFAVSCLVVGGSLCAAGCAQTSSSRTAERAPQEDLEQALAAYKNPPARATRDEAPSELWTKESELAENLARGHREAEAGRPDQAVRFYERVLREDPRHPVAHHRLAVIADQNRDFAEAEAHYAAALETRRNDPDVLNDLGYCYLLQGRYPESERTLREAISLAPGHERALTNLGLLYGTIGDVDRALAVLRLTAPEEEARAKLALLMPGLQAGPDRSEALAPPIDSRETQQIVQAGAAAPIHDAPALNQAGGTLTPAMQDLMAQMAQAKRTTEDQRPAPAPLPGLIDPAEAAYAASLARENEIPQPYSRSDREHHMAARPAVPQAPASYSGEGTLGDDRPYAAGIVDANVALPRSAPSRRSAEDLPLWSPPVTPQPPARPEISRQPPMLSGSTYGGDGRSDRGLSGMPSGGGLPPASFNSAATVERGTCGSTMQAGGAAGLPPLAYPPAFYPSAEHGFGGGAAGPEVSRTELPRANVSETSAGYVTSPAYGDPGLRAYAADLARRDAETAEMRRLMQPPPLSDPAGHSPIPTSGGYGPAYGR